MRIKDEVLTNAFLIIRDGSTTCFWEDKWVGNVSLKERHTSLFNIVRDPHASVVKILATHPFNISFLRNLQGTKLRDWSNLVVQILLGDSGSRLTESTFWNRRSTHCQSNNTFHAAAKPSKPYNIFFPFDLSVLASWLSSFEGSKCWEWSKFCLRVVHREFCRDETSRDESRSNYRLRFRQG
jgi:hypothetical protein